MRRTTPLLLLAAAFTAANGWIHLDERLNTYANLPSSVPGAWVVTIGFWVNAAICAVASVALVAVALGSRFERYTVPAAIGAAAVAAGSIVPLVLSRESSIFGWQEPIWTSAAKSSLAVEIATLVALGLFAVARTRSEDTRSEGLSQRPQPSGSPA